jgi:hypothetical protein
MWLWKFYICMILSLIMQAASRSHTNSKKVQMFTTYDITEDITGLSLAAV